MRQATLVAIAVLLAAAQAFPGDGFLLRDGDRVVFFGDSITEQKLYTRYVAEFVACRYPERDIRFYNAGWGGDTAKGGRARLPRDVLHLGPTVVTLFFGMNDGAYRPPDEAVAAGYRAELAGIVADLKAQGVRAVVFSPGAVDDAANARLAQADYNATLAGLAAQARAVAAEAGVPFVDVHGPMRAFLEARRAAGLPGSLVPDGIHPNPEGHLMMAAIMLGGLGAEAYPALGSFDLRGGRGENLARVFAEREDVFLRATGPVLVPFPIPAGSERTARDCGLVGLVAPSLRVSGLPPGGYEVAVGEAAPVRTTAADLARGVPLPLSGLPRSTAVRDYVEKREANYFSLWRGIRVGSADVPGAEEAARGMMALDDGYHAKAREAAGPLADVTIRIARAPEGENLALGKPYECSDPNRYSWGAGGLTDGSWEPDARHCFATGDGAGLPKTVTVDLGKPCRISAVRFGVPPFGSTRTVKVSVSAKGRDFTTVGSVEFPQRAAERRTVTFATATARYVRLTYEDRWPEEVQFPPVFAFTTELEVFGAS